MVLDAPVAAIYFADTWPLIPHGGIYSGMTNDVLIEGMHCDGCVRRVQKALERVGIENADVEVGRARLATPEEAAKALAAIQGIGFAAKVEAP